MARKQAASALSCQCESIALNSIFYGGAPTAHTMLSILIPESLTLLARLLILLDAGKWCDCFANALSSRLAVLAANFLDHEPRRDDGDGPETKIEIHSADLAHNVDARDTILQKIKLAIEFC